MLARIGTALLRGYIGWQIFALVIWIGVEIAGYGFGVLDALLRRPLTNVEGSRPLDWLTGGAPPGPERLSRADHKAVTDRLAAAFPGAVPQHKELTGMRAFYTLKRGSHCDWRHGANIANDQDCNKLANADLFFVALLQNMHPKTQHLFWREIPTKSGGHIQVAYFAGLKGKPQILIDFSRMNSTGWDLSHGFQALVHHGGGTGATDVALGTPLDLGKGRVYLIDDPGAFQRRTPGCDKPHCFARFHLYAFPGDTTDSMGRPVRNNLADLALDTDLEQRFKFQAVLLGQPVPVAAPVAKLETKYKVTDFAVTNFQLVHVKRNFDVAMGSGAYERAVFAPVGYHVAFGTVFGVRLDGKLYTVFQPAISHAGLGTDRFVFKVINGRDNTVIDGVKSADDVHVLPYPGSAAPKSGSRLTINKASAPGGRPDGRDWSEFENLDSLFAALASG
jgi:hypothetical protein